MSSLMNINGIFVESSDWLILNSRPNGNSRIILHFCGYVQKYSCFGPVSMTMGSLISTCCFRLVR